MNGETASKRDLGSDLSQGKVGPDHWVIEGYDVYPFAHWEGTHTSRGANIECDGEHVTQVGSLSEARGWIREQISKGPLPAGPDDRQPEPEAGA
jgi:hypothetical protein